MKKQIKKIIAAVLIGASTLSLGAGIQTSAKVYTASSRYERTYSVRTLARWYGVSVNWDNSTKVLEVEGYVWPIYDLIWKYPNTIFENGTVYMTESDFVDAFDL